MSPAAQKFAIEMQNGTAQLETLTTATQAAQIGTQLLISVMNIGLSIATSLIIKQVNNMIHDAENALKNAQKKAEEAKKKVDEAQSENEQITDLIAKYKELQESEERNSPETKSKLLDLQQEITDLVGKEAENVNLVNGALEEQLGILDDIANKNFDKVVSSAEDAYRKAVKATNAFYISDGVDKNIISLAGNNMNTTNEASGQRIVSQLLTEYKIGKATTIYDTGNEILSDIEFNDGTTWEQRLEFINDAINKLKMSKEFDTREINGIYDKLIEARDSIQSVVDQESETAYQYLSALVQQQSYTNIKHIDSVSDFVKVRQQIIEDVVNDESIQTAILNGTLNQVDIEKNITDYLSSLNGVSEYYDKWIKQFATQSDYEKAKSMLSLEEIEVNFDYSEYKEKINETTDTLGKLSSAYEKLKEGNATSSDILSLIDNFPELAQYATDTGLLTEKIKELGQQEAEPLLTQLRNLAKTIKDPEQKSQIEGLINQLEIMAGLSEGIKKTADAVKEITAADYIKYEEDNIQKIIDKLETEKDSQNDILDSLKEQKETLEHTISEYEKIADVVGKYIDRTQIQPLEDRKSEVEEYYNAQIDKLKEANDELDRNLELQEKQNALANAQKRKIRVHTETEGWVWKNDNQAIRNAEKDLTDYQNNMSIESLEKARDKEVKNIDDQIKSWEKYKDEWKKQVEAITEADNELIASKILGADWQEQVAEQNIEVMTNYGAEYASYNDRLKNQVEVEIRAAEKAIKEREKEITDWKDYKTDVSNLNKEITDSNSVYLNNFNQFVLDENSTWEDRIAHMKRNIEIIRQLNEQANQDTSNNNPTSNNDFERYAVYYNGSRRGVFTSADEAENHKRQIAENIARSRTSANVPASALESMIQGIIRTLSVEHYATGGVSTSTGFAWLDGSKNNSEVIFNSQQAKELYNLVRNGDFSNAIKNNILNGLNGSLHQYKPKAITNNTSNAINMSFDGANINAESYESFKSFMDRYTNDLFLKMQTGKK